MSPAGHPSDAELKEDWYALLGVEQGASDEAIKKSYRKLALTCHPDKTDDIDAADKFDKLTKTKDFLLDPSIRGEYDEKRALALSRERLKAAKTQHMGERRARMKSELEKREASLADAARASEQAKRGRENDLDRLRREGQARRAAAAQKAAEKDAAFEAKKQGLSRPRGNIDARQMLVKWKRGSESHSDESLVRLFGRFGSVEEVVFYGNKGNAALITFSEEAAVRAAVSAYNESDEMRVVSIAERKRRKTEIAPSRQEQSSGSKSSIGKNEMESVAAMRVRQAAERRRMMREMAEEEAGMPADSNFGNSGGSGGEPAAHTGTVGGGGSCMAGNIIDEDDLLAKMMAHGRQTALS
jgi:curved DNA-binding protein CbpA